jgi:hypothetical protein
MQIIVHAGRAHADDFLAACVCRYKTGAPVLRTDHTLEMLENPDCWVLDQGGEWDPELHNFDHHHLEQEICSLTMVLDHFYGDGYRTHVPGLRFIEINDSYGSKRAAEFAGVTQESLEVTKSPIHSAMLDAFSRIEGLVDGYMAETMLAIGREVCDRIGKSQRLLDAIDEGYSIVESSGIMVLDVTRCRPPNGHSHDVLPTKTWCKIKGLDPEVILTKDSRKDGSFRMVSVNLDSIRFLPNHISSFTHASGFLTSFDNYDDYAEILSAHTKRG